MTPRLRKKPSQAQVVGAWLGTYFLLRREEPNLPISVLADVAARLVPLMDLDQPVFSIDADPAPVDVYISKENPK